MAHSLIKLSIATLLILHAGWDLLADDMVKSVHIQLSVYLAPEADQQIQATETLTTCVEDLRSAPQPESTPESCTSNRMVAILSTEDDQLEVLLSPI